MLLDAIPLLDGARPLSGHNHEIRRDRLRLLERVARHPSPLVRIRLPLGDLVLVTAPDALQEVLIEKARAFEKSTMVRFTLYPLAGEGLFTSGGELWRRQRKLMAPLFHPQRLEGYGADMVVCAEREMETWRDGQALDVLGATTRIAMSVAGKTLFDADTFSDATALGEALTVALEWTSDETASPYALAHLLAARTLRRVAARTHGVARTTLEGASDRLRRPTIYLGDRGKKLRGAIGVLDDRVAKMIDDRRREGLKRPDLLTRLLKAQDEDQAIAMSDKQVRDEILTLFIAGHETTATGLAWSLAFLCKNPAIYAAIEREALSLGKRPDVSDLPRLPLALRVFKEALRIYPPVYMVGRRAIANTTIGGYEIPRETPLMIAPYATQRREDVWPDPERFDPDRFLPEREEARHRLAWLPFGAGPRVCIGNHFALMEAQLVLATLLQRYRFEALREAEAEPATPSATLRPAIGARMRVHLREKASMVA